MRNQREKRIETPKKKKMAMCILCHRDAMTDHVNKTKKARIIALTKWCRFGSLFNPVNVDTTKKQKTKKNNTIDATLFASSKRKTVARFFTAKCLHNLSLY